MFRSRTLLSELAHPSAPPAVLAWCESLPPWLEVCGLPVLPGRLLGLDAGEEAAIVLAQARHASLVLMDECPGVLVARRLGLRVTGTLGVLGLLAQRGGLNLSEAVEKLAATNLRAPRRLFDGLLAQHGLPALP